MRQTLHIVRKDLSTLWMELSLSLVALSVLTWSEWHLSTPGNRRWYLEVFPDLLLFLAWWLLIVRLIHAEALVGDRQFWVTRPYIWYKLLAAKAFFILGAIGLPLVVSQSVLIFMQGSPVSEQLIPILRDTGGVMLVGVLPIAAIATITPSFGKWALYTVTVILAISGIAALLLLLPNSDIPAGSDVAEFMQGIVVFCLCTAAILIQYASRKTNRSMLLLVAALISLPLVMICTPSGWLIESAFPIVNSGAVPVHTSFGSAAPPRITVSQSAGGKPELSIPIQLSVAKDGALATLDIATLSIDLPPADKWKSAWHPIYNELIESMPRDVQLRFEVDRGLFQKAQLQPASLRLTLGFSEYRDANRHTIVLHRHFDLPGVGSCWIEIGGDEITCRSTATSPSLLLASVGTAERRCQSDSHVGESETCGSLPVMALMSTLGPLTPLALQRFYFYGPNAASRTDRPSLGESLTFSAPELIRRFRVELGLGVFEFSKARHAAIIPPPRTGLAFDNQSAPTGQE